MLSSWLRLLNSRKRSRDEHGLGVPFLAVKSGLTLVVVVADKAYFSRSPDFLGGSGSGSLTP